MNNVDLVISQTIPLFNCFRKETLLVAGGGNGWDLVISVNLMLSKEDIFIGRFWLITIFKVIIL